MNNLIIVGMILVIIALVWVIIISYAQISTYSEMMSQDLKILTDIEELKDYPLSINTLNLKPCQYCLRYDSSVVTVQSDGLNGRYHITCADTVLRLTREELCNRMNNLS